jgi:hypothetical protein
MYSSECTDSSPSCKCTVQSAQTVGRVAKKINNPENRNLLEYYAAYSGNTSPSFWDFLDFPTLDGTDRLPRNFGKELPLYAV